MVDLYTNKIKSKYFVTCSNLIPLAKKETSFVNEYFILFYSLIKFGDIIYTLNGLTKYFGLSENISLYFIQPKLHAILISTRGNYWVLQKQIR